MPHAIDPMRSPRLRPLASKALTWARLRPTDWPRAWRDTLLMLALIAGVIALHAPALPIWATVGALLVVVLRAGLTFSGHTNVPTALRLALLGALILGGWLGFRTLLGRDVGITLLVVLLALKTLELRAQRDAMVVFLVGFFLLQAAFLRSQSLLTAVWVGLLFWGLLAALVHAHRPVQPARLRDSARMAAQLVLLGLPLTLLLFVFFPRVAPLWSMPSAGAGARSGLSADMTVGQVAELALDSSVALRVAFDGPPPPAQALYFRGPVLEHFDGQHWRADATDDVRAAPSLGWAWQGSGTSHTYRVTLEPHQQRWLLALDGTSKPPVGEGGLIDPRAQRTGDWLNAQPLNSVTRYLATMQPDAALQADADINPQRIARERQRNLATPPQQNPRLRQWIGQLAQRSDAPASAQAWVQTLLAHLRQGGYRYTLAPGVSPGPDTADVFWFDTRAGFCEHIAASFVLALRQAGVPARVVTGYQGGERNAIDGLWTVRQSDAHAWAEYWDDSARRWLRVDPTAAVAPARMASLQRLSAPISALGVALWRGPAPAWSLQARALIEAVQTGWNHWVLQYDAQSQLDLLRRLGLAQPQLTDLGPMLAAGVALSVLAAGVYGWVRQPRPNAWQRLWQRAQRHWRRRGLVLPPGVTPRQLADLLTKHDHPETLWSDWLLRLERARYGRQASAQAVQTLAQEWTSLPRSI